MILCFPLPFPIKNKKKKKNNNNKALMNLYIRAMRDFSTGKLFLFQEYYKTNLSINYLFFYFLACSKFREVLSYIRPESKERTWLDILSGSISRKKHISNVSHLYQKKTQEKKEKYLPTHEWHYFNMCISMQNGVTLIKNYEIHSRHSYNPCCVTT